MKVEMYRPHPSVILSGMKTSACIAFLAAVILIIGAPAGSAKGDSDMIAVGEPFVDFELPAHDGSTVSSTDLMGHPYLLFFYPKADTPG
jgi:cytochrome oxidase Cu insertion factor (SCO1/SenC/PrrC family)